MKWMPLTDDTLQQLRKNGYTHLIVKNITAGERTEIPKEFVTLEAVKDEDDNTHDAYALSSEMTDSLIHSSEADYYVLFR